MSTWLYRDSIQQRKAVLLPSKAWIVKYESIFTTQQEPWQVVYSIQLKAKANCFVGINLSRILGRYLRILERTPVRVIITLRNHLDDELRWRYVATVTTGFCNQQPVSQIGAICKLWNEIRFDIKTVLIV